MAPFNTKNQFRPLWVAPILTVAALILLVHSDVEAPKGHPALAQLPPNMLWAWERAEDLRWLPSNAGVAYVAATLELEGDQTRLRPRAYPLSVRPDTVVVPVVHVDASWRQPPTLSDAQLHAIAAQVLMAAATSAAHVVQLDFEVRRSQRAFLMQLVRAIRHDLPPDVALSVTALASWCAGDYWIESLPADEIVPMAFRMAQDDGAIRLILMDHGGFTRQRCQDAIGIASDEPVEARVPRRHYFFSPTAWDAKAWRTLMTISYNRTD